MPELPEVETVKRILESEIIGKTIENVTVFFDRLVQSNLNDFSKDLHGKTINSLSRYGKFLFIHFSGNLVLISHLRMEGKYRYASKGIQNRIKSTLCLFDFSDGSSLAYNDTRKFGIMYLTTESEYKNIPMIAKLGIEANTIKDDDIDTLYTLLHRNKPIKELITDQSILCGIGNIYADEILFDIKVNPLTKGNTLSKDKVKELANSSNRILAKAIELGGSTVHSFHPNEGIDGKFQEELDCYGHEKEPCKRCGTPLHKIFLGGRGTTFCPNCQINKDLEKAIGITGPIASGKSTVLQHFNKLGYTTISCDEEIHTLYRDPVIKNKISKILKTNFDIDNQKLVQNARILMNEKPSLKKNVEDYIYPILEQLLLKYIKNNDLIAIEVPLLFKAHYEYMFKKIFVITTSKEKQLENLNKRGEKNEISAIKLNKDFTYDKTNKKIIVINNNFSSIKELNKEVDKHLM